MGGQRYKYIYTVYIEYIRPDYGRTKQQPIRKTSRQNRKRQKFFCVHNYTVTTSAVSLSDSASLSYSVEYNVDI